MASTAMSMASTTVRQSTHSVHNETCRFFSLSSRHTTKVFLVTMSEGPYPIPSRTRKSSPPEPMVLRARVRGRVGRCQVYLQSPEAEMLRGFSFSVRIGLQAPEAVMLRDFLVS